MGNMAHLLDELVLVKLGVQPLAGLDGILELELDLLKLGGRALETDGERHGSSERQAVACGGRGGWISDRARRVIVIGTGFASSQCNVATVSARPRESRRP